MNYNLTNILRLRYQHEASRRYNSFECGSLFHQPETDGSPYLCSIPILSGRLSDVYGALLEALCALPAPVPSLVGLVPLLQRGFIIPLCVHLQLLPNHKVLVVWRGGRIYLTIQCTSV